jgi:hypothetical protein
MEQSEAHFSQTMAHSLHISFAKQASIAIKQEASLQMPAHCISMLMQLFLAWTSGSFKHMVIHSWQA